MVEGYDIELRAQLRDGSRNSVTAQCFGAGYAFACSREGVDAALALTRGPDGSVLVRSQAAGSQERPRDSSPLGTLLDLPLGRADNLFRLDAAGGEACAP